MEQQLLLLEQNCWCPLVQILGREHWGAEGGPEDRFYGEGGMGRGGRGSGEGDPGTSRIAKRTSLSKVPLSLSFARNRSQKLCSESERGSE